MRNDARLSMDVATTDAAARESRAFFGKKHMIAWCAETR
jgi:hypothetical protein